MTDTLDTAKFYKNDAFSDLTIRYGGREFRAHRIILCSKSEYFGKAIGPESKFKESLEGVLELKEDDPDAVEGMLRYLYTAKYCDESSGLASSTKHQLNVAIIADKYNLQSLRFQASSDFCGELSNVTEAEKALEMIILGDKFPDRDGKVQKACSRAIESHFMSLFQYPVFRDLLQQDEELKFKLCNKHLEALMKSAEFKEMLENDGKLAFKLLEPLSFFHNVVEGEVITCDLCNQNEIHEIKEEHKHHPPKYVACRCGRKRRLQEIRGRKKIWMMREH